jgi:hypothetical protein
MSMLCDHLCASDNIHYAGSKSGDHIIKLSLFCCWVLRMCPVSCICNIKIYYAYLTWSSGNDCFNDLVLADTHIVYILY